MYFLGPYWWLLIPGLILGIYAQIKLSAAYNKYVRVPTRSGLTGAQAAREILDQAGLNNVPIQEVGGHLENLRLTFAPFTLPATNFKTAANFSFTNHQLPITDYSPLLSFLPITFRAPAGFP